MGPSKKCWFWCNGPSTKAPEIPLRHQKTFHLALFLSNLAILRSAALFQGLKLVPKSRKKPIGALSCMHKGPKCIQSLWDHPKKFLLCKRTRKARYVRSLGKKPHFGAFPEAKKGVVNCARLRKASHWPNNNANQSWLSEKKVYCVESLQFCQ